MPPTVSAPVKGIAYMVAYGFVTILQDAIVKLLTSGYPVGEIVCVRALFIFIPLALFARAEGGLHVLRTRTPGGQALRALFVIASNVLFVLAIRFLPLTEAVTLTFTSPFFASALAFFMLGERVGWRRWAAVGAGFVGVAVILRPTPGTFQLAALIPLAFALVSALRDVFTRRVSFSDRPIATLFYSTLAVAVAGGFSAPFGWVAIPPGDLALFAIAGVLYGLGDYLMIQSFRYGEVATVMPFKYTFVLWTLFYDFVLWGAVPDRYLIAGSALIIGSGLYILRREHKLRAAKAI
ncbi:MAG: DMT family transporter [Rhodospirillales bacterium]|nr:DMT family transporter [Rhodospirillales bacterium]